MYSYLLERDSFTAITQLSMPMIIPLPTMQIQRFNVVTAIFTQIHNLKRLLLVVQSTIVVLAFLLEI
jgi:hypothetical protein